MQVNATGTSLQSTQDDPGWYKPYSNTISLGPAFGSLSFYSNRGRKSWKRLFVNIIFGFWRLFPNSFRVICYGKLWELGRRWYPHTGSYSITKVLPGVYLKMKGELKQEKDTLEWLENHTMLSAPWVLDFAREAPSSETLWNSVDYLLISEIPGKSLMDIGMKNLTEDELIQLAKDLRSYFKELRSYTTPWGSRICGPNGSTMLSWRVFRSSFGPFADEASFNSYLTSRASVGEVKEIEQRVKEAHRIHHRICFSHGDLSQSNVMMHNGRLSGIVDWECSGFFPEYWDYSIAFHPAPWSATRWHYLIRSFLPSYRLEHEAEYILWGRTLPI